MTIPQEAVEAAAEAIAGYCAADWPAQAYEGEAQAALEAAAPFIRAQALTEAADDYRHYETPNARLYLRARADKIREGK